MNTKCVQRVLNKLIDGNRCLAGSEGCQAARVAERTELGASGRRQIVEAQALVLGIYPKFLGRRPDGGWNAPPHSNLC